MGPGKKDELSEKIKNVIEAYTDISKSEDLEFIKQKLGVLQSIGSIDELSVDKWIAEYKKSRKDYLIREPIAFYLSKRLFPSNEEIYVHFLYSYVQMGLTLMESYSKSSTLFFEAPSVDYVRDVETCFEGKVDTKTIGRLIKEYFKDHKDVKLNPICDSVNEVGKIDYSLPTFEQVIIKRSKGDLSKEYNILKYLWANGCPQDLPTPVSCFKHKDGLYYIVMTEKISRFNEKSDDVRPLSEIMSFVDSLTENYDLFKKIGLKKSDVTANFKINHLKRAINNLAQIQDSLASINMKPELFDIRGIISNKISKRLNQPKLEHSLEFLANEIKDYEYIFTHGDYHPGNILVKFNRSIPIDFERVNKLPRFYDLAFLTEQNCFNDLSDDNKKEIISSFLISKNTSLDEKTLEEYHYTALFINLRCASISSRKLESLGTPGYKADINSYLKKAIRITEELSKNKRSKNYQNLMNLKTVLEETITTNTH